MKNVSVTDFKAHLSRYLREIKRGGQLQVMERGIPIAHVSPLPCIPADSDESNRLRKRLVKSGVLRPGHGQIESILKEPPPEIPCDLTPALLDGRMDRL